MCESPRMAIKKKGGVCSAFMLSLAPASFSFFSSTHLACTWPMTVSEARMPGTKET
jgi:hypothetical protein